MQSKGKMIALIDSWERHMLFLSILYTSQLNIAVVSTSKNLFLQASGQIGLKVKT